MSYRSSNAIRIDEYCSANFSSNIISGSIAGAWTEQAVECFNLNANCSKCSISKGNYSFICKMPLVIEHLLKNHGEPI